MKKLHIIFNVEELKREILQFKLNKKIINESSFIEKEKLFQEVETLELELKNIKRNTQQLLTNMMNLKTLATCHLLKWKILKRVCQ